MHLCNSWKYHLLPWRTAFFFFMCVCVYLCSYACSHTYEHVLVFIYCGCQKLILGVFLHCFSLYLLIQGLSLYLVLPNSGSGASLPQGYNQLIKFIYYIFYIPTKISPFSSPLISFPTSPMCFSSNYFSSVPVQKVGSLPTKHGKANCSKTKYCHLY